MSKRKPFYIWILERFIAYGDASSGMGWFVYWIFGLMAIGLYDILVLRSDGSAYFFGYLALTVIYVVVSGCFSLYAKYLKETENTPPR